MQKQGNYEPYLRRIVLIEDNIELREAYSEIIQSVDDYAVVKMYDQCQPAIRNLAKDDAHLMIVDLTLPGMSGIEGIAKIKKIKPEMKILVVTVHDDSKNVFDAFCAGAIGYLTKDAAAVDIVSAIEQVFAGGAPMTPKIANMIISSYHLNPKTPLTERETDVLRELSQGKTYDYIARALDVSKDTVKTHIRHIYEKLHVNNKSEAVIKAKNENLV